MTSFTLVEYFLFVSVVLLGLSIYLNIKQKRLLNQRKNSEAALIKEAYFDPVTDLPNRKNIELVLNEQIARSARHGKSFSIVSINIGNYRDIKINYKDKANDILVQIGDRLLESTRDEDILSHIEEDEFILVLNEYIEDDNLDILFRRINNALEEGIVDEHGTLKMEAEIGKSKYPDDASDARGLIYKAKNQILSI
ncbi:MAG: GGDEF domain-containing protein [Campylobacterota bacterium]|nr:GGDEF domain-containing protein [Campylobacterota bacterium]